VQPTFDHIAVAVPSIRQALPLYELLTGASGSDPEEIASDGVRVAFIGEGAGRLELVEPAAETSAVSRFLARRGPGLHHIAYRVPDLAATLDSLAERGIQLIDRTPRAGAHGRRVAFLHPRSTNGVLIELVEEPA
jgi:methylmalonyl-CoA epimerase